MYFVGSAECRVRPKDGGAEDREAPEARRRRGPTAEADAVKRRNETKGEEEGKRGLEVRELTTKLFARSVWPETARRRRKR